jgi:hypothetical protein
MTSVISTSNEKWNGLVIFTGLSKICLEETAVKLL